MDRIQRVLRQKELRSYDGLGRDTKRDELIARGGISRTIQIK
jgi:hypothetical protein